jgi:hypothetical protein
MRAFVRQPSHLTLQTLWASQRYICVVYPELRIHERTGEFLDPIVQLHGLSNGNWASVMTEFLSCKCITQEQFATIPFRNSRIPTNEELLVGFSTLANARETPCPLWNVKDTRAFFIGELDSQTITQRTLSNFTNDPIFLFDCMEHFSKWHVFAIDVRMLPHIFVK